MQIVIRTAVAVFLIVLLTFAAVWAYAGLYGVNVVLRHGGTCWTSVRGDSSLLSPSMRLALASAPTYHAWRISMAPARTWIRGGRPAGHGQWNSG
jgi:hypothetical protein